MESYEASRTVFTRIQTLDPENASKIMGYILLNHTETDMLHFSYAPETLLISLVNRAKNELGLSSNTLCALPISNPISISRPNPLSLPLSSPRLSNGFHSSSPNSPSIWSPHHFSVSPKNNININNNSSSSLRSNGSFGGNFNEGSNNVSYLDDFCSKDKNLGSFHRTNSNISNNNGSHGENVAFLDDFTSKDQNLGTFLTDPVILPSKNVDFTEDLPSIWDINSNNNNNNNNTNSGENNSFMHRRSSSFNESMLYYGTDESTCGFGLKPCLYYARGFCKNGSNCKFVHGHGVNGGFCDDDVVFGPQIVGSPCSFDSSSSSAAAAAFEDEFFRSKFAHHQRFAAAHLLSSGGSLPYPPRSAAALMMSEDMHKLNRLRMARNEFGLMDCNPGSRQIYLTFPADSTFKEEDVSSYFNKFGPVQDVRIPYQQKRMFGFVTFVFPETVKIILAKGNPHFVCDSRVLVKPYKEKGKLPDKKQHPYQFERGEFSCSSPSSHDCREPFDFQLGGRMPYSTHELLLRKKLEEQADFRHALEFQERRLMNMQLFDMKTQQNQHHLSARSPVSTNIISIDSSEESTKVSSNEEDDEATHEGVNIVVNDSNENVPKKEEISQKFEENEFFESLDHVLPDNLFASPTKSSSDIRPASFSPALTELGNCTSSTDTLSAAMSSLSMAPPKSCFFEMPRISNGHGAIGM